MGATLVALVLIQKTGIFSNCTGCVDENIRMPQNADIVQGVCEGAEVPKSRYFSCCDVCNHFIYLYE